ncbi:hypothetical protein [uncultured Chryseobacterium sp.]|uniref:hypothetical protein n=1 Tax=uncultured Chryseobacterium sp. TaxID=259322 RepID=UPI0025D44DBE|nr:hypothetical protein [uncultured Chryseobacterium sp.]
MTMTKKMISWLSILTVFLTLLGSCHNEDFAKGETEPQRNNANFFKHTKKGGINAKSGVDYVAILEAYNREKDFLTTMPDQQGMPIWDKMQIMDAENATGLMIPLSYDNKSMSSVLFAIVDDENTVTGVRDFDNRLLENITYSGNVDKAFREKMLYTFMYMDHKTFGNEDFTNIPTGLFDDLKYSKTYGRIKIKNFEEPQNAVLGNTGKIMWTQMCSMVWSCSHHGEGTCDYCMQLCHKKVCGDFMVFIGNDTDYPTPSSGGSEGGGGATPSPDGIPPKDACIQTGMPFYRLAPQCVGNGDGDITDENSQPPKSPCETLQQMIEDQTVKNAIDELKPKTLLEKKEFAQEISREFNGATSTYTFSTNLREGTDYGTNVSTGGFIKGNAHNHPKDGVRIPSVDDIQWLNTCQQDVTPSYVVTYNIIVCANHLTPNDYTTANLYAIATDDRDMLNTKVQDLLNRPDLVGKTEKDKKDLIMAEDDLYYQGLNDNPSALEKKFLQKYGNFGLSLYRFNKTTNKWMKLTTDGNTITETPCE